VSPDWPQPVLWPYQTVRELLTLRQAAPALYAHIYPAVEYPEQRIPLPALRTENTLVTADERHSFLPDAANAEAFAAAVRHILATGRLNVDVRVSYLFSLLLFMDHWSIAVVAEDGHRVLHYLVHAPPRLALQWLSLAQVNASPEFFLNQLAPATLLAVLDRYQQLHRYSKPPARLRHALEHPPLHERDFRQFAQYLEADNEAGYIESFQHLLVNDDADDDENQPS